MKQYIELENSLHFIVVDVEDYQLLSRHKWILQSDGYARTSMMTRYLYIHQMIMPGEKGMYVDHINHDKLDNRKNNLRLVTNSQNQFNRKNMTKNTGVSFHRLANKWRARITIDQKEIHLGLFETKEKAIEARKKAFESRP